MKIGVFDSGIGGLSVAKAIEKAAPEHEVIFVNDTVNVPYGTKTPEQLLPLVIPILEGLVARGCMVIVIACNTVSTTLIEPLRAHFTVPLIALEPMVKPAAEQSKAQVFAVCATPTTLASERYKWLKATYAAKDQVIEPDCSDWAALIERSGLNESKIKEDIEPALVAGADVIVLGCTHYHWIEEEIRKIAGPTITILQPEQAVVAQLNRVLENVSA